MSPYMLWLALAMLTAVTRQMSEGLLQQATLAREPLFASALETFELVPAHN